MIKNKTLLIFVILLNSLTTYSQCPTPSLYDGIFTPSTNPTWVNCINLSSSPDSFQISFGSPNTITSYILDFGDGTIINSNNWIAGAFINHTYQNLGIYTVTLIEAANGCTITIIGTVINERTPTAGINGPPAGQNAGCAPHAVCFGNNSFNVTPSTIFTWDFGDGATQTFDYINAGQTVCHTYDESAAACGITVSLTASNNCGTSTTTWNPVDIFKPDVASITPANSLLCYPDTTVTFTNTSVLNCISGTRLIYWNFGDGTTYGWTNINIPITHTFPGIGTYTIMMVDSNACGSDTAYATVTIVAQPTAGITALEDTICFGQSITFTNNSFGGGNLFTWNFGDTTYNSTTLSNQTHTFNSVGNQTISLITDISGATGSCVDNANVTITVLDGPITNFNLDNNQACDSLTVNITDLTTGASNWFWDFGNGNTSSLQNPLPQIYNYGGVHTISLISTSSNGCTNNSNKNITINISPDAQFNVIQACIGDTARFYDLSTITTDSINSWLWSFDDGGISTQQNPYHIYQNGGNQMITLLVNTPFCSSTQSSLLMIDSLPIANFTPDNIAGCADLTVDFINNSAGATNYTWRVNGVQNSTNSNLNYTFTNSSLFADSIYIVNLVSETSFGCIDDTNVYITVHPLPVANFSSDAFPQCSPLEVNFTNSSINYSNSYWNFDNLDSSTATNSTYTFVNDTLFIQTYSTQLIVESIFGCKDTIEEIITVYPKPNFDFQTDSGCSPLALNFNSNAGAVIYAWDFGDGNFSTGPNTNHTFTNSLFTDTTFNVQLIATSSFNCSDTTTKGVEVYSIPNASFTITPSTQTFPNATINFTNLSTNATSFTWDFGDTTTFIGFEPDSHIFNNHGNYAIILIAENHFCIDTTQKESVIIPAIPVPDFNINDEGCRPLAVTIENNSTYADSYLWDFGDGGTSTQQNPSYTYYNSGTYTISLIAKGEGGQTVIQKDSVIVVHELPEASFTANPKLVHLPNENVNFYNLSTNAINYYWDFGDGNSSYEEFPTYLYQDLGEFKVTLIANNEFGCADTATDYITTIAGGNIIIPNAFTPNPLGGNGGDINSGGLNDVFYPITEGVTTFEMKIFNRWGEVVFISNNPQIGWDGYYKGVICKQDVYVYKLNVSFENGETAQKIGDITLLR